MPALSTIKSAARDMLARWRLRWEMHKAEAAASTVAVVAGGLFFSMFLESLFGDNVFVGIAASAIAAALWLTPRS